MKDLKQLLAEIYPLGDNETAALAAAGQILDVAGGDAVIKVGRTDTKIYLLLEGVLRAYIPDGVRNTTVWFAVPGDVVFSSWGYVERSPSQLTVSASCDSRLLVFELSCFENLLESSPRLAHWFHNEMMKLLLATDQMLVDFSIPGAQRRYEVLLRKMPTLLQYVPLKDIAGFLGVTPQSLSRIRSNVGRG